MLSFDFSHYFIYQEMIDYLNQIVEHYPNLIEIKVIGKSYEGRDLIVAILTNQATGPSLDKPGYWIDANTHAGEVTGSAVTLYAIYTLLDQYNSNQVITRLLDDYTIYVLPRIAVDGAEKYLTTPYNLRSSTKPYPYPKEQDGLHPEDINEDGLILSMRLKHPCGAWKVSDRDPRLMVRREPDEFDGVYYCLLTEGWLQNYNGFDIKVSPNSEGLDFCRNYPYNWKPETTQKGAGDFPYSEPETLAEAEFWRTHRNINGFLTYHTFGGVLLRPYNTYPDSHFLTDDLEVFKLIGQRATQITGYECVSVFHSFSNLPCDPLHGVMDDHAYELFGWFGFTPELWDTAAAAGVKKYHPLRWIDRWRSEEDELALLKWNDEKLCGKGFINWQKFHHSQLGEVELGGWDFKKVWQNAPSEYLPDLCEKQCRFIVAHALMSPRLRIPCTRVTQQGSDLYHLLVVIENHGFLPTYTSKKGLEQRAVRPIEVTLTLPEGGCLIMGEQYQEIAHLEGRSNKLFQENGASNFRCTVQWVIRAASGSVQVTVFGERSGRVQTNLILGS